MPNRHHINPIQAALTREHREKKIDALIATAERGWYWKKTMTGKRKHYMSLGDIKRTRLQVKDLKRKYNIESTKREKDEALIRLHKELNKD